MLRKLKHLLTKPPVFAGGIILLIASAWLLTAKSQPVSPPFRPHDVGQSAWFRTVESAITTNRLEANATPFVSETGIIQIGVKVTSGSATAGTITVYTQMANGDTVYSIIPTATYSLIASANKVSDIINIGPGYHKLVVSGATGTFNFNLTVRDF